MAALVVACAVVGFVLGRIPAAVAERVFAVPAAPLLLKTDLTRPLNVEHSKPLMAMSVQVTCSALFAATAAAIGMRWVVVAYLWFAAVTFALALTDVDRNLIPNRILFPAFAIALGLLAGGAALDRSGTALLRGIAGTVIYFLFLLVVALAARGGFGMGDVKLGALLGAFLAFEGWSILVVGAVSAFILGGAVSLVLLVFRLKGRKDAIPFGPYLVLGSYVALAAGERLADWYTG